MIFNWTQLTEITRGQWRGAPLPKNQEGVKAVVDDSQRIKPGDLFIAVQGDNQDGHNFIDQAIESGATAVCVNKRRKQLRRDIPLLCVDNTLNSFHELARAHRRQFPQLQVIGITGSNGKTSVRCMLSAIFETAYPGQVLATEGNTNNHFGVPRNLLRLTNKHRLAVLEIGSNKPGEIAQLTRLIRPQIGIITNIGPAHLENFGDMLGVVMEKGCLLAGLPKDGTAVIPETAEYLDILKQIIGSGNYLTFGRREQADIQVFYHGCSKQNCRLTLIWSKKNINRDINSPIGGRHQADNAAAAAAAATVLGVSPDIIAQGLSKTKLPAMRMDIKEFNGCHWVNDAYNANPASMYSGIDWFLELTATIPPDQRFFVPGDMLELGKNELEEHIKLLVHAKKRFPETNIFPVGPIMKKAAAKTGLTGYDTTEKARDWLHEQLEIGAWILLKGSRKIKLENII